MRILLFKFNALQSTTTLRRNYHACMALWLSVALSCKLALANVPAPLISINKDLIDDVFGTTEWCEWYKRYPFHDTPQPQKCLSGDANSQCSRFSENACSRVGASAYVTIAQFPKAFHLRRNFVTSVLGSGLSGWHVYDRDTSAAWSRQVLVDGSVTNEINTITTDDEWDWWKKSIGTPPLTNVCLQHYLGTTNTDTLTEAYYACLTMEDIQTLISDVQLGTGLCQSCDILPFTEPHGTTGKEQWYESKIYSDTGTGQSTDPDAYVGCLGIPGMRDDDSNLCQGRHTSCLINANSLSKRVCELYDTCISKRWIRSLSHPLVEPFTHRESGDGSEISQFETVILKTPQSNDAYLQIFDCMDCECQPTTDVRQHGPGSTGAYALDLNTQSAKIFVADASATCRCEGDELRWDSYDLHTGLHHCWPCPETSKNQEKGYYPAIDMEQATDFCFGISNRKCVQCPPNHYRADRDCERCPVKRPKRTNWGSNGPRVDPFDEVCVKCQNLEWFDTTQDPHDCAAITELTLDPLHAKPQNLDYFHKDLEDNTIDGFSRVDFGYFRIVSDGEYQQHRCSCADAHKFPKWCGAHEIQIAGLAERDVYVEKLFPPSSDMVVKLWSEVYQNADWSDATPIRRGQCTDCALCPFHHYNEDCGHNYVDTGVCAGCKDPKDTVTGCLANQYLTHSSEYGCFQQKSREDYECKDCKFAEYDESTRSVYLWIGCGMREAVLWWTLTNDARECRYDHSTGVDKCTWRNPSTNLDIVFSNRRNTDLPETPGTDEKPGFINVEGEGLKIPYCPPGWHVKESCMDETFFNVPFRQECCEACEVGTDASRQTENFVTCTGATVLDTQKGGFTTDCPAQSYSQTIPTATQDTLELCKRCTTCPGQNVM